MFEFKQRCIDITEKMRSIPICAPFLKPIDPVEDHCTDYLKVIKSPMDLETVAYRLNGGYYKTVEEWINDVELIWKNAMIYNDDESFLYLMALDMQCWFRKKASKIPRKADEEWLLDLKKTADNLSFIINGPTALKAHK